MGSQDIESTNLPSQILFDTKNVLFLLAGLALLYVAQIIYYLFLHPLHKVPGPALAKFSSIWRKIRYFRSKWHDDILEVHESYGPIVRIGPNEVSFVDVKALTSLYGHGTTARKTEWYRVWFIPNMQQNFFASQDTTIHRALRRRVSAAYSMSSILFMEPFLQEVADKTWARFRGFADSGCVIDLAAWVPYFTFDVVGQLSYGGEIGKDVDNIISSLHTGFYLMANMGSVPLQMFWFNNPVMKFLAKKFGSAKMNAFDNFLKWLQKRIEERMYHGLGDRRREILQHFVEMKGVQGQETGLGDVMIECVNIVGAGADTTSIAILAVLSELILHPEIVPRLQVEVDLAYKALGYDEQGTEIRFKEAFALPYLAAVVKESMRLHPSIQYQLPRYPAEGGIQIGPYHPHSSIRRGQHQPSIHEPEQGDLWARYQRISTLSMVVLQQERRGSGEKEMTRLLMTFGMGSRVCVGMNLGLVEVHKLIAQFVHKFEMKLADPEKLWTTNTQWFSLQHDFNVRLLMRERGNV